jgi:hypothetical protein
MILLADAHRAWVAESLDKGNNFRDGKWKESIAVGSEAFVTATKEKLGVRGRGRVVIGGNGSYELQESLATYKGILGYENEGLRLQNAYFWSENI